MENIKQYRKPSYEIDDLFLNRWSRRSMSLQEVSHEELMALFEAARWAPSSYNNQPWRFLYAKRNTANWDLFFNLMGEFNQGWAKNASVLVVIISKKTFDFNGKDSVTHSFDAGAAWENLALQAHMKDLVAHGMEGFDYAKAKKDLEIPDAYSVEAMLAIGKPGKKEDLSEALQEKETPSDRKPLEKIVIEGKFAGAIE